MRKYGCSDHGCVYGGPKGMGTNGGCKCLHGLPLKAGAQLRVILREYRKMCGDLQTENDRLNSLEINAPLDKEELCAKVLSLSTQIKECQKSNEDLVKSYLSKSKEILSLLRENKQLQLKLTEADKDRTKMSSVIHKEINVHFRHIQYEFQNENTLTRIGKLWDAPEGSADCFELSILAMMVSRFEGKAYPIGPPTAQELEDFLEDFLEDQTLPTKKG